MAESDVAKVLSAQSNIAVFQLPTRNYPGSVVQGDSLYSLFPDAIDLLEELKSQPDSEAFHAAYSIAERLEDQLRHYCNRPGSPHL